ncbi:MAG: NnrS family protein [Paracoccaceae bacterium]
MTLLTRLLTDGFRIFFLSALIFALVTVGLWEVWLASNLDLPVSMPPQQWHAHEMIFGYGTAALGGFLLTAVPNWTGGKGAARRFITLAFALWLVGRLAMLFSDFLPAAFVTLADLAFVPALILKIGLLLMARPKPQQMIFLLALSILWAGNLMCHLEWLGLVADGTAPGLRAGLLTLVAMIVILGGRVTPGFTKNAMVQSGRTDRLPRTPAPLAIAAIAPALTLPVATLLGLPDALIAALAIFAGAAVLARVALWQGLWTLPRPILWTLHLSYAVTGLGLVAHGLAAIGIGSEIGALHILGIGSVGGMTLSVLSRAALGHSGRPLIAARPLALAYGLLPLAALSRYTAATVPDLYTPATLTAGALWLAAFALALANLWPALLLPRPPRAPVGKPPQ